MESDNCSGKNTSENNLDLMSFDLGEAGGGKQTIFMHKSISETEHYVLALGRAPQNAQEKSARHAADEKQTDDAETSADRQLLSDFRSRLSDLKIPDSKNEDAELNKQNLKLRFFKLTRRTEGKNAYLVEEYVTPQSIADVARILMSSS